MDEAAPQAAQGKTADEQALEVLRRKWGQWYRIGRDDVRDWWAQRRDDLGGDITAGSPDKLQSAVSEDFALKPVTAEQAVTVTAVWAAAEAQRARDGFEADRLAAELCCDVTPHPLLEGRYEAVYDGGAMIGTAAELRASRRAQMLAWLRYGRAVGRA